MAITATALGSLLTTQADYNYYIQQQMFWSAKYEANSAKLSEQAKLETKWWDAHDKATDSTRTKELKAGNVTIGASDYSEPSAYKYADAKVSAYDEELSLELADLDIEYDTMKTMYDTLVQQMSAQKDSEKTLTSNCAQDTGLITQ